MRVAKWPFAIGDYWQPLEVSAAPDLYYEPVQYGIDDVTIPAVGAARILFPSNGGHVFTAPIRPGTYPLVVFVHGDRSAENWLCPPDLTRDYRRWMRILHLLAECGFVVVAPDVHAVINSEDDTSDAIEETVKWMHFSWQDRDVLWRPGAFLDPDRILALSGGDSDATDGVPAPMTHLGRGIGVDPTAPGGITTHVGLAGHSWGARACALAAARGKIRVRALASIAGSWDSNDANAALVGAKKPTLMIAGTADQMNASYLNGFWSALAAPKHQALLFGLGHWDWFGRAGGIQPCDAGAARPRCTVGWWTAGELLLTFMAKNLRNQWSLPPRLIGPSGVSTHLLAYYDETDEPMTCGLRVRWNDPLAHPHIGDATFGSWPADAYQW